MFYKRWIPRNMLLSDNLASIFELGWDENMESWSLGHQKYAFSSKEMTLTEQQKTTDWARPIHYVEKNEIQICRLLQESWPIFDLIFFSLGWVWRIQQIIFLSNLMRKCQPILAVGMEWNRSRVCSVNYWMSTGSGS